MNDTRKRIAIWRGPNEAGVYRLEMMVAPDWWAETRDSIDSGDVKPDVTVRSGNRFYAEAYCLGYDRGAVVILSTFAGDTDVFVWCMNEATYADFMTTRVPAWLSLNESES